MHHTNVLDKKLKGIRGVRLDYRKVYRAQGLLGLKAFEGRSIKLIII